MEQISLKDRLAAVEVNLGAGNWVVIAPDGRAWALNDLDALLEHVRSELDSTEDR